MTTAYLNGSFLPLTEARVSVLDRGFLFADGVYEVIPVYGGRAFSLTAHLQRLHRSLQAILLENPLNTAGWQDMIQSLLALDLAEAGSQDRMLYIQVTRGATAARSHALPEKPEPTVLAFCQPLPVMPDAVRENGVSAITRPDTRWLHCDVKSIALLGNVLLSQQALSQGCNEAILLRDGQLTEGASSNVFVIRDGQVFTPPNSPELLPGITRDLVLTLTEQAGLARHEQAVSEAQLRAAEEIWITSSTRELYPVTRLDEQAIGNGKPGPLWARVYQEFQDFKRAYAAQRNSDPS
ncbi:MAG: D-amino acid aminotransferase [Nevskiales bacterium]